LAVRRRRRKRRPSINDQLEHRPGHLATTTRAKSRHKRVAVHRAPVELQLPARIRAFHNGDLIFIPARGPATEGTARRGCRRRNREAAPSARSAAEDK
jgi:hypothetical protein